MTVTFLRPSGSQPEDAEKAPAKAAKGSPGTMIVCKSNLHNIYIHNILLYICVRIGVYIYILCVCMYVYVYVYIYIYMNICRHLLLYVCVFVYTHVGR